MIKRLSSKHTVILSSHILSEVSAVCDRVMIINKGKMIVDDVPENLAHYANRSSGLNMVIKGDEEKVTELMKKTPEVSQFTTEKKGDSLVAVTVYAKDNKDIREELFYACANEMLPIYELSQQTITLEDTFLELTKEQPLEDEAEVKKEEEE